MRVLLVLIPVLLLAACSGPRDIAETPVTPPPPEPIGAPSYETFDPSAYDARPAPAPETVEVVHDVPPALMDGRIDEPVRDADEPRVVQGFRIQLFSSESKPSADAVRDDAITWWRSAQRDPLFEDIFPYGLHPAVVFSRPYYRVRIGAFPDRAEAEPALDAIRERYPEAFIVPDTITLERD